MAGESVVIDAFVPAGSRAPVVQTLRRSASNDAKAGRCEPGWLTPAVDQRPERGLHDH
jgi:hypothetical protein